MGGRGGGGGGGGEAGTPRGGGAGTPRAGGAGGRAWAREVLRELQCAVCLGTLARPASLPCGHSFCRACLRAGLARAAGSGVAFCCPACRADVPEGFSPKVNVTLRRVVELAARGGADAGSPLAWSGRENTPPGPLPLPSPAWAPPPPQESPATAAAATQAALMLSAVELRSPPGALSAGGDEEPGAGGTTGGAAWGDEPGTGGSEDGPRRGRGEGDGGSGRGFPGFQTAGALLASVQGESPGP